MLFDDDFTGEGFNLKGTMQVQGGGNSGNLIQIRSGDIDPSTIAPVPVPAALPLLLGGFGVMGFVARRRKRAA